MKKEKIQLDFGTDSITVQQDSGNVFSIALMPDRPTKTALAKTMVSLVFHLNLNMSFLSRLINFKIVKLSFVSRQST